jgi:hypothetical protein
MRNFISLSVLILLTFSSYCPLVKTQPSTSANCTFVLSNETWNDGIYVWVKAGNQTDCNQRAEYGIFLIERGKSQEISVNTDICWRREADPSRRTNPTTYEASWNNETCFASGGTKRIVIR